MIVGNQREAYGVTLIVQAPKKEATKANALHAPDKVLCLYQVSTNIELIKWSTVLFQILPQISHNNDVPCRQACTRRKEQGSAYIAYLKTLKEIQHPYFTVSFPNTQCLP